MSDRYTGKVDINSEVYLYELVENIVQSCSHEYIMNFILDLDLRISEHEFTSDLVDKLSESLDNDDDKATDHKSLPRAIRLARKLAIKELSE